MLVPLKPFTDEFSVNLCPDGVEAIQGNGLVLENGANVDFDLLILAAGRAINLSACEASAQFGFKVDDFESTRLLDEHLKTLNTQNDVENTIIVVGSSFTGIEIITKLRQRLGRTFRLVLLDKAETLGASLEEPVKQSLSHAHIEFRGKTSPTQITASRLTCSNGQYIDTATVIFATGFRTNALTEHVSQDTDQAGRSFVDEMVRAKGQRSIFAAGDVASAVAVSNHRTLMSCQHAMPMGITAGRNAVLDLLGEQPEQYTQPFYATCLDPRLFGAVFTNGWQQSIVKSGIEDAEMKQQINTKWIYPPVPTLGRKGVFSWIRNS